jgi:hypothetical protein
MVKDTQFQGTLPLMFKVSNFNKNLLYELAHGKDPWDIDPF